MEALVPLRLIRSRIRYEDVYRRPYTLVFPDYHHRNEMPVRLADPTVSLHIARAGEVWNVAGRAGVSIPIGRTGPNPFALGRLGLPHEHFQLGTGIWDPIFVLAVSRQMGSAALSTTAFAHMTFSENAHAYRAGNRYSVNATLAHPLVRAWGGSVALDLTREEAERWNGRLEEEGNLGRTDALLSLSVGHGLGSTGAVALTLSIPVYSKVRGGPIAFVHGEDVISASGRFVGRFDGNEIGHGKYVGEVIDDDRFLSRRGQGNIRRGRSEVPGSPGRPGNKGGHGLPGNFGSFSGITRPRPKPAMARPPLRRQQFFVRRSIG